MTLKATATAQRRNSAVGVAAAVAVDNQHRPHTNYVLYFNRIELCAIHSDFGYRNIFFHLDRLLV